VVLQNPKENSPFFSSPCCNFLLFWFKNKIFFVEVVWSKKNSKKTFGVFSPKKKNLDIFPKNLSWWNGTKTWLRKVFLLFF